MIHFIRCQFKMRLGENVFDGQSTTKGGKILHNTAAGTFLKAEEDLGLPESEDKVIVNRATLIIEKMVEWMTDKELSFDHELFSKKYEGAKSSTADKEVHLANAPLTKL